jgi:hypothetical protein
MMSAVISLFYVSLAICVGMIVLKLVSLRNLKLSLIESIDRELYNKISLKVHEIGNAINVCYYVPFRTLSRALFFFIARQVLHAGLVLGNKIKVRHVKWYNMVKGKGVIKQKGSVSFFLRDVAEHKKMLRAK